MTILKGITWQNPRGYEPLAAAARAWTEGRDDGLRIEWEQHAWYRFEEMVLAGCEPGFDLLMFDHPWTGSLVRKGRLVPWDNLVSAAYLERLRSRVVAPSVESYELGGHLWGLPLDASCHAALYRRDLLEASRLPSKWEDVADWALLHHAPPNRYGLVLSVEGVLGHCLFLSMMAGAGCPAYADPEHPTCDRAAAEYVLTTLRRLLRFVPPGSTRWGPWDIYEHLTTQDDVGYCPSIFAYANYFGPTGRQANLALTKAPGIAGREPARPILGGVGLGISPSCHSEARDFALFLMEDATQRDLFPAHSGQPAAWAAWRDSSLNASTNGFYRALGANMTSAYIRPTYAGFHELELKGGRTLQLWWDGQAGLSETLSALHGE